MDFNTALLKLGFTPIEATVFITLCKNGELTGYEVAKLCGISRSNVYAALYNLLEKGRCYSIDSDTTKYIALSKDELISTYQEEVAEVVAILSTQFPAPLPSSDPYVTVRGYANVLHKIKHTILSCQSHLYILAPRDFVLLFEDTLLQISHSRKVSIISDEALDLEDCLIYTKDKAPVGFHMIIDTQSVITGDLGEGAQCLYTTNQSLVRLMRESFVTELDMIQLTK